MKCPVCEKMMDSMVCGCGFDASRDYGKYPAFGAVPKGTATIAGLRSRRKKQIRKEKPKVSNCPVCEKRLDSMVCDCGYDGSRDYGSYPAFGPAAKGTVSVSGLRLRAKSLIRCADCGYHGFSLDRQKGELCCLQCGRALTAQELKPLRKALGWDTAPVVKKMEKTEEKTDTRKETLRNPEQVQEEDPLRMIAVDFMNDGELYLLANGTVLLQDDNLKVSHDIIECQDLISIAAGPAHFVGMKQDGTAVAAGDDSFGRCNVSGWVDLVAIAAGLRHSVGLKKDGTVVAVGDNSFGQCKVSGWRDIIAIAARDKQTIGLKRNGTVVAAGFNKDGRCNVAGWKEIVKIAAGINTTVGLRKDGTVVAAGVSKLKDAGNIKDLAANEHILGLRTDGTIAVLAGEGDKCRVEGWQDIVFLAAGSDRTVALKQDGTVMTTRQAIIERKKMELEKMRMQEEFEKAQLRRVVDIAAGAKSSVALLADGTLRVAGRVNKRPFAVVQGWKDPDHQVLELKDVAAVDMPVCVSTDGITMAVRKKDGTAEIIGEDAKIKSAVAGWKNVTILSAGTSHVVGCCSDGTMVAAGSNSKGECSVQDWGWSWKKIIALSAGNRFTIGLKEDGSVVAAGDNIHGQCKVSGWRDIVAISAGDGHTVGLKQDGSVVAVGRNYNGQCNVSDWRDIVAISAGANHTAGLKKDGTVVSVGMNYDGECNVSDWRDIVAISTGYEHTIGLKKDGTIVATGKNDQGQCGVQELMRNREPKPEKPAELKKTVVSDNPGKQIAAIATGWAHTVVLYADGTVGAIGENLSGACNVSEWRDIKAISAGYYHTVGLRKNGTVVAVGSRDDLCNVAHWEGITDIAAGGYHTVARKSDGTVVATGSNRQLQCNVSDWQDIVSVAAGEAHTVAVRADGTVIATGSNEKRQCDVSDWQDIVGIAASECETIGLKADDTVVGVGRTFTYRKNIPWTDVAAVFAGGRLALGLKKDGTVLEAGDTGMGKCSVKNWKDISSLAVGHMFAVGLKKDGTLVAVGENSDGQCDVQKLMRK